MNEVNINFWSFHIFKKDFVFKGMPIFLEPSITYKDNGGKGLRNSIWGS